MVQTDSLCAMMFLIREVFRKRFQDGATLFVHFKLKPLQQHNIMYMLKSEENKQMRVQPDWLLLHLVDHLVLQLPIRLVVTEGPSSGSLQLPWK